MIKRRRTFLMTLAAGGATLAGAAAAQARG
jgi:hypothetical protein